MNKSPYPTLHGTDRLSLAAAACTWSKIGLIKELNKVKRRELIFRIEEYFLVSSEEQELFLIRFINNFVYKNKWYVGGAFVLGDLEDKTDLKEMKTKLLNYLKRQKTLKIKSVIFQKLIKNDFVDVEEVFL